MIYIKIGYPHLISKNWFKSKLTVTKSNKVFNRSSCCDHLNHVLVDKLEVERLDLSLSFPLFLTLSKSNTVLKRGSCCDHLSHVLIEKLEVEGLDHNTVSTMS
jgi:hypothetical protein